MFFVNKLVHVHVHVLIKVELVPICTVHITVVTGETSINLVTKAIITVRTLDMLPL